MIEGQARFTKMTLLQHDQNTKLSCVGMEVKAHKTCINNVGRRRMQVCVSSRRLGCCGVKGGINGKKGNSFLQNPMEGNTIINASFLNDFHRGTRALRRGDAMSPNQIFDQNHTSLGRF